MSGHGDMAVPTGRWRGDDFPSWLSPMLVRELRQGVQSGGFAWTFVVLQGLMFLLMSWAVTNLGSNPGRGVSEVFNVFFWLIVGAVVAVVVPLRALTAVSSERPGNNLDLVRLTRLSATRIILGKWLAVVAQGGLVALAVMPYLVLRYFFGGVNVVRDLQAFGWVVAVSMVVAAWAVAVSTLAAWARIAVSLACGVGVLFLWGLWMEGAVSRMLGFVSFETRLAILGLLGLYTVAFLEFAAARIAPPAENHAVRKRGLALVVAMLWIGVGAWGTSSAALWTMAATMPLVVCWAVESLLESHSGVRSLYTGFARLGGPGRVAAAVLSPGWATGVPFLLVLFAWCLTGWIMATVRFGSGSRELVGPTIGALVAASLIFPLPFVVYLRHLRQGLLLYLLVELLCFMAFVFVHAMKPHGLAWATWDIGWVSLLPLPAGCLASYLALVDDVSGRSLAPVFIVAAAVVSTVAILAVWVPLWREQRAIARLVGEERRRLRSAGVSA
jgi:hypothetical protein